MNRKSVVTSLSLALIAVVVTVTLVIANSSTPRLASQLLGANQMPPTWQAESFTNAVRHTGCLATVLAPQGLTPTSLVDTLYVNEGTVPPEIGEALASYRHPVQAYARIVAVLDQCRFVHPGDTDPSGITGSVTRMPLPAYGEASAGFHGVLSIYAVPATVTTDLAVVRQGSVVMELFEANTGVGRVDLAQFHRYVSLAWRRLGPTRS